jgi:hypothetical protein
LAAAKGPVVCSCPERSGCLDEHVKASGEAVPVRLVATIRWEMEALTIQVFQRLQDRAVLLLHQRLGNVDPVIGIDADQVGIEGTVMELRKW